MQFHVKQGAGGLRYEAQDLGDVAGHLGKLARSETDAAGREATQKMTRYREGRASALRDVADMLLRTTLTGAPLDKDAVRPGLELMERQGGGFARSLAQAGFQADSGNWALLSATFSDLFREYQQQAEQLAQRGQR